MNALPMALTRQILAVHATFYNRATTDDQRNAIIADLLAELRFHNPSISVWDLLPIFDLEALR